jgi:hypothetical protein
MKKNSNDPLLQYCAWMDKRVSTEVLIGIFCVCLLLAAFVV